jgi:hypothetical protein
LLTNQQNFVVDPPFPKHGNMEIQKMEFPKHGNFVGLARRFQNIEISPDFRESRKKGEYFSPFFSLIESILVPAVAAPKQLLKEGFSHSNKMEFRPTLQNGSLRMETFNAITCVYCFLHLGYICQS